MLILVQKICSYLTDVSGNFNWLWIMKIIEGIEGAVGWQLNPSHLGK